MPFVRSFNRGSGSIRAKNKAARKSSVTHAKFEHFREIKSNKGGVLANHSIKQKGRDRAVQQSGMLPAEFQKGGLKLYENDCSMIGLLKNLIGKEDYLDENEGRNHLS